MVNIVVAQQIDYIAWSIGAIACLIYGGITLRKIYSAKIGFKLCAEIATLIVISSLAVLIFTISSELVAYEIGGKFSLIGKSTGDSI